MTDTFEVRNPANGKVIQTVTRNSPEEIKQALKKRA